MAEQITWTKEQRELCKTQGKTLFAVGLDDRPNPNGKHGAWKMTGLLESEKAVILFLFGQQLYEGDSPKKAFEYATKSKS